MQRRSFIALAGALAMPAIAADPPAAASEWTFLKAEPGAVDALARFIEANWFAMDAIAVERGLMSRYALFESRDDGADWDLVVVVDYPQAEGYAGIRAAFEQIRADHQTVPIDGRRLPELGRIVGSRRLRRRSGG
jgi:hypothetical protein